MPSTAPARRAARPSGAVLVLGAAVVWGTAGTVQELAVPGASPLTVAAVRCLLGGVVLVAVAAVSPGRFASLRGHGRVVATAAAAMVVFQTGYLAGIRSAGVAIGTLVAIGSAPVWAGAIAVVGRRRPPRRWWAATLVAVVGLAALVAPDAAVTAPTGVLTAAMAGVGYAGFVAATAQVADVVDRLALLGVVFVACGLVVLAVTVVVPGASASGPLVPVALAGYAWLGLATITAGYLVFTAGLRRVDPPTATTLTLAEPLTATVLALTVVGERLDAVAVVGVVVLVVGLRLTAGVSSRRDARSVPPTADVG